MSLTLERSLSALIRSEFPSVWKVSLDYKPSLEVNLFVNPNFPLCSVRVSRFIADTFDERPYTISIQYEWNSSRLNSILKQISIEERKMSDDTLPYVYVIFGSLSGKRIPFGSFSSRAAAESAIENGSLSDSMDNHGLRMSDCDHYTVERWEVGRFLEDDYIKTLTSYDRKGNQMMRFKETSADTDKHMSGRLASILTESEKEV